VLERDERHNTGLTISAEKTIVRRRRRKHHCHFEQSEKSAFNRHGEKQISHPMKPGSK
jgi:hypothetical protein